MYPIRDVILATREITKKTKGGIFLPDAVSTSEDRAEVVAVGPGIYHPDTGCWLPTCAVRQPDAPDDAPPVAGVKPGDVVLFDKRNAFDYTEGGRKFIALPASSIAVVIPASPEEK